MSHGCTPLQRRIGQVEKKHISVSHVSEQKVYTVYLHVTYYSIAPQDNPKHRIREEQTRLTAASESLLLKTPFVLIVSLQQHNHTRYTYALHFQVEF